MARVKFFDMSALDAKRAINFYEKVFNWKFKKWDEDAEFWIIETGPEDEGINGGLSIRQKDNYIVNSIYVESVDKTIKDIKRYFKVRK